MVQTTSQNRKRRWVFRIAALALGILPFVGLELLFSLIGLPQRPASADPLVDLHQLQPLFVFSETSHKMVIPPERLNHFRPESFDPHNIKGSRRAFVLGGSTVQGRPFSTETAFSSWLELTLQAGSSTDHWQCINCGGISYASYRVAAILDEVLRYSPDVIVLYVGHNEFLEDRTYGALHTMPKPVSRGLGHLSRLRTIRWLADQFRKFQDDPGSEENQRWIATEEVQARLDRFGGLDEYQRDAEWRSNVIEHFQQTLQRMVQRCRDEGVPLIVCIPVSDLQDTPPFKVQLDPDLRAERIVELQTIWEKPQSSHLTVAERLEYCERILTEDPRHAGAAYVKGRLMLDSGDTENALRWLTIARDWDVCPLRATSEITQAIRDTCATFHVPVVDVEQRCASIAEDGIVGRRLLIDHVHPTIETHQKIAEWIFEMLVRIGLAYQEDGWQERQRVKYAGHLAELDEAYFARGFQRLEGLRKWASGRAGEMSLPDESSQ